MENSNLRTTPKDVFLHLFNILCFYLSVIGVIMLYIKYIAVLFPDPLNFYFTVTANSVRLASAFLVVAVPAYLFTGWLLAKDLANEPKRRELKLRKWLIYFTLFIAAITIIVDLVTFVYNFLSGELTIQFVLKVLVVLVVAAAVFGYYFWELKRADLKSNKPKLLAWVVSVFTLLSIVAGFFIIGTPASQRNRRFDEQRVQHLQTIQSQIINYWTLKNVLPPALASLQDNISGFVLPQDPLTKQHYEYNIKSQLSFELCASFATRSDDLSPALKGSLPTSPYEPFGQNWSHGAGQVCFERTIDPQLYKLRSANPEAKIRAVFPD